ncbi:MAG TPA: carboxypeptidase M32, partial [Bacillota bacterium]
MRERFEKLLAYYREVYDLSKGAALLGWDQQCYMPPAGSRARAEQMATLTRLIHARMSSPALGELLEAVAPWAEQQGEDSFEASVVRVLRRRHQEQVRVPAALAEALSRAGSTGFQAWVAARRERRFDIFKEAFERIVALQRELADALGWEACRYDALLDLREPGVTTAWFDRLFGELRAELVPLVRAVASRQDAVDDAVLRQGWDEQRQWQFTLEAVRRVGYDLERGRQDRSVHPFTTSFSPDDVRITTRLDPNFFSPAFFASLHEAGHALYMQGVPGEFYRTPLDGGASSGVHESQSRMWENLVGRSRAFWAYFFPRLREVFPAQ